MTRRQLVWTLFVVLAVSIAQVGLTQAGARHIVHYDSDPDVVIDTVGELGGTIVAHYEMAGLMIVDSDTPEFADVLEATGIFDYAVEDRETMWLDDVEISGFADAAAEAAEAAEAEVPVGTGERAPESALYYRLGRQWSLEISEADQAWQITTGDPEVKVAVLDTGICQHPRDLQGKIDEQYSRSFVDELSNCARYPDLDNIPPPECTDCPDWEDYRYHGTHVAGIISSNNIYTAGVAPRVRLRAVKVLRCNGNGAWSGIIQGIMYAVDTDNDVINMSLGGGFLKSTNARYHWKLVDALNRAVNYAQRRGALIVSAAGNNGYDLQHDYWDYTRIPCQSGSGLCIGATTSTDDLATFSNHGMSGPQLTAPGGGDPAKSGSGTDRNMWAPCSAHSAFVPNCSPGHFILALRGTSMAAPIVSGAAALIDSAAEAGPGSLRSGRLRSRLLNSADDLGKVGSDNVFSHGRVNVRRAVE